MANGVARTQRTRLDVSRLLRDPTPRTLDAAHRFLSVALVVLAVGQAVLLVVVGRGPAAFVAIALTVASLNIRLQYLQILACLIVINFGIHLAGLTPPFPYRLAYASIIAGYGAIALAALAAGVLKRSLGLQQALGPAMAVGLTLGLALIASEAWTQRYAPIPVAGEVRWIGRPQPHPILGEVNPPYGVLGTVYPDNSRGFFDQSG